MKNLKPILVTALIAAAAMWIVLRVLPDALRKPIIGA
jgi:hypothetical protein